MSAQDYLNETQFPLDPYYNEIPETRGEVRVHAHFRGTATGRELSDQEKMGTSAPASHAPSPGCLHCTRAGLA